MDAMKSFLRRCCVQYPLVELFFLFFFARPSFSLLYTRTRSRMLGLYMPAGETPAQRSNKTTTSELGYLACWAKAAELVQQQQQHLVLAKQNPTIV